MPMRYVQDRTIPYIPDSFILHVFMTMTMYK